MSGKNWLVKIFVALAIAAIPLQANFVFAQSTTTGLPVPRLVSLRADQVNLRAGPGVRYPISWVYKSRNLPLQVIAEYDTWRKVRDWEGSEGWIHRAMLSSRGTVLITRNQTTMRISPDTTAIAVAKLGSGIAATLDVCENDWCRIRVQDRYRGWVPIANIWGTALPDAASIINE